MPTARVNCLTPFLNSGKRLREDLVNGSSSSSQKAIPLPDLSMEPMSQETEKPSTSQQKQKTC
jgi:hypothetical protein